MKLLITGAWEYNEEEAERLRRRGHIIYELPNESESIPCEYEEIEGIICNGLFLHHPIQKFKNLKYIQLTSAGFDRVPMEYIEEKKIEIHNARGVYSVPMAEFVICGVLQIYKQSFFFGKNKIERKWEKNREILELFGKVVCIVGCGSVGIECAKRFRAFGCEVIGIDVIPQIKDGFNEVFSLEKLKSVISRSDIVVLTLPLTDMTYHLVDADMFVNMKRDAMLVNISRGKIVDTKALIQALETKLMGAVMDVFEEEPLPKASALWSLNNAIISPHNSFVGEGNKKRLSEVIFENLKE